LKNGGVEYTGKVFSLFLNLPDSMKINSYIRFI